MKLWAKATPSLKQGNDYHWCHFHLHMSHKAAISMAKLISQYCGDSQLAVCLSEEDGAIERLLEHSWMPDTYEEKA